MNKKEKERIKALYGSEEEITSYLIYSGTKIGNTTKSKLDKGIVEDLEN